MDRTDGQYFDSISLSRPANVTKNSSPFSDALSKLNAIKARLGSNEIQLEFLVQTLLKTCHENLQESSQSLLVRQSSYR